MKCKPPLSELYIFHNLFLVFIYIIAYNMKCSKKKIKLTYFRLDSCLVMRKILKVCRENNWFQFFLIHKNYLELQWVVPALRNKLGYWSRYDKIECIFFTVILTFLLSVLGRFNWFSSVFLSLGYNLEFSGELLNIYQCMSPSPDQIESESLGVRLGHQYSWKHPTLF